MDAIGAEEVVVEEAMVALPFRTERRNLLAAELLRHLRVVFKLVLDLFDVPGVSRPPSKDVVCVLVELVDRGQVQPHRKVVVHSGVWDHPAGSQKHISG